jgi:hypothetical protein
MQSILIGKVETDPLIHYGGVFNTFSAILILSLVSFLLFVPFIRSGRYKNLLLYIFTLMPVLNIYYRNNHPFVGGVFIGHLLYIMGVISAVVIVLAGFDRVEFSENSVYKNKRVFWILIVVAFIVRAILIFGSRPTDSGMGASVGAILFARGSSMFEDYWGVVSIGARYGPMLYLAYLPFVPLAHITKYFLWGEALTPWTSVSDVPLSVATAFSGALFYEGLILFILIRAFKKFGLVAALIYLLNPLDSLILSVNANELPQTALFLLGIYLLKKPIISSLAFVCSSLMKIYPIVLFPQFALFFETEKRRRFLISSILFAVVGFGYWFYMSSLAPPSLRTNPVRDIFLYQGNPGPFHSIWYFTDIMLGRGVTYGFIILLVIGVLFSAYRLLREKRDLPLKGLKLSIITLALIILVNRSVHPGYYYFLQTLLFYLFFYFQENTQG